MKIKKSGFVLALFVILFSSQVINAQDCYINTDIDNFTWGMVPWDLKDNVRLLARTTYKLLPNALGFKKGDLVSKNSVYFNTNGKQILDSLIRTTASSIRTTYIYDSSWNVTEMSSFHLDGKLVCKFTFKYNNSNQVIEQCNYNGSDSLVYKSTMIYDKYGNLQEKIYVDKKKKDDFKCTYKYDDRKNETEEYYPYYANDSLRGFKIIQKFDSRNNMTDQSYFNNKGGLASKNSMKYNSENEKIECINYGSKDSIRYKVTYKYNADHKLTEVTNYDATGNLTTHCTRTYDDHGNITEAVGYKSDGTIDEKYNAKWEYDDQGNWVSMTTTLNGKPQAITEWKTGYYK
jgi:hypothetical protein